MSCVVFGKGSCTFPITVKMDLAVVAGQSAVRFYVSQDEMKRELDWGDIYYRWLRKGVDHSYAAYMANQWEKRKKRKAV